MEIDFAEFFNLGGNTLEVYLCPSFAEGPLIDIPVGWPTGFQEFANLRGMQFHEFCYNDVVCSYDKSNDSQKVYKKTMVRDMHVGNLYIAVFLEEQVPSFMFPTSLDMSREITLLRKNVRLNNRLFIMHDTDATHNYLYLKYNHSDTVDMVKVKNDLNAGIQRLMSYEKI
jgi:hypothetical protein